MSKVSMLASVSVLALGMGVAVVVSTSARADPTDASLWNFYETGATATTGTTYLVPISVEEILDMPLSNSINYTYNGGGGCNVIQPGGDTWTVNLDLKNSLSLEAQSCNYQATVDLQVVDGNLEGYLSEVTDSTSMNMTIVDNDVTASFVSTTGNAFGITEGSGTIQGYWEDPDADAPGRIPVPTPEPPLAATLLLGLGITAWLCHRQRRTHLNVQEGV